MGVKYRLEFYGLRDKHNKIEIEIPDYNGDVINLDGVAGNSAILSYIGDENIFESHVLSSQLSIEFYDKGNIDLDELMLTPDLEYRVKWYINDRLNWSGFLIADGIQESLSYRNSIKLTAVDGMKSMEGLFIKITNPQGIDMGSYVSAIRCPLNILRQCFNTIGNNLPVNWMCETKNSNFYDYDALAGMVSWSPRGEILTMKSLDCYEIFEEMLRSFNLHCFQMEGEWYIVNYIDLANRDFEFSSYRLDNFNSVSVETKDFSLDVFDKTINDSGVRMLKKPVSKVEVIYESTRDENVVPNGSMNYTISENNSVMYWTVSKDGVLESSIADGISGRVTDKYDLTDTAIKFKTNKVQYINPYNGVRDGVPFDAKILYPRFTLGLSVMPINFPTYTSGANSGQIKWVEDKPLQIEITYRTKDTLWYLNENGYWIEEGMIQLVVVDQIDSKSVSSRVKYGGAIQKGQYIRFSFRNRNNIETGSYTHVFDSTYSTLAESEQAILDAFSNSTTSPVRAYRDTAWGNADYIGFTKKTGAELVRHSLSDVSGVISTKISLIALNSQNEDVVRFQFTSKGGESRIKIPEPEELDTQNIGIMNYKIFHNGAYESVIDDVYINVDENFDKYTLTLPSKKDSKEEYKMKISSSFSGFILSNYMNSWATNHETMMYDRYGIKATLTEHYGRDVLALKSNPYQIIDNEYIGMLTPLSLINGNMLPIIKCDYNACNDTTQVTLMEFRVNSIENVEVTHKGSNDDKIS